MFSTLSKPFILILLLNTLGVTLSAAFVVDCVAGHVQGPGYKQHQHILRLRGGQQEESIQIRDSRILIEEEDTPTNQRDSHSRAALAHAVALPMTAMTAFGKMYASSLQSRPILTKSTTAGFLFALSDYMAQKLEKKSDNKIRRVQYGRMLMSAAVGFFYFGPAAHYWYGMIFRILPGTTFVSILQKATLGQLFFGPTFTCIFFASSLLQSGTFSLSNWGRKIKLDLPGAWLAGAGFWPLVDLVSYSLVSPQWIPLFVNLCSLVWTTYLVLKSYS